MTGYIESILSGFKAYGEENCISSDVLRREAGLGSMRTLQKQIEEERKNGSPILSSLSGGFFLPSEDDEIAREEIFRFIHCQYSRAFSLLNLARIFERRLRKLPGQEMFTEVRCEK